jgi:hypothetical protein
MKLWLLKQRVIHYDQVAYGFVIRATTEADARCRAAVDCGDEGMVVWNDPAQSTCTRLTDDGAAGIVLRDFRAG